MEPIEERYKAFVKYITDDLSDKLGPGYLYAFLLDRTFDSYSNTTDEESDFFSEAHKNEKFLNVYARLLDLIILDDPGDALYDNPYFKFAFNKWEDRFFEEETV